MRPEVLGAAGRALLQRSAAGAMLRTTQSLRTTASAAGVEPTKARLPVASLATTAHVRTAGAEAARRLLAAGAAQTHCGWDPVRGSRLQGRDRAAARAARREFHAAAGCAATDAAAHASAPTAAEAPAAESSIQSRDDWYGKKAGSTISPNIPQSEAALHDAPNLTELKMAYAADIDALSEVHQLREFARQLETGACDAPASEFASLAAAGLTAETAQQVLQAGLATMVIHVESRIAALLGQGFYTIGPGGEELLGAIGAQLRPDDAMALHYRHLSAQIARQLRAGRPLEDILLDRARGHMVSRQDPVTGGVHCAIGSTGPADFIVTSTLASQAPPAVGRALGTSLAHHLGVPCRFPRNFVSLVSVGDGSVNNAHFLAATNTATYAFHRGFRCPVVFVISDNDISISLKGHGYLTNHFRHTLGMPVFSAHGGDLLSVWAETARAISMARRHARPVTLIYNNLPRRFGHAATDRQGAYLTPEEIQRAAESNPLAGFCAQLCNDGVMTFEEIRALLDQTVRLTEEAFEKAAKEAKHTDRNEMRMRSSAPLLPPTAEEKPAPTEYPAASELGASLRDSGGRRAVMRKHMTRVLDESLAARPELVYVGEDVIHGGYYVVTDGLADKYPARVRDFPPDETSLIAAGIGYAQVGLLPVVEIPYAKYLDCGYDMFTEACIANWLSNGNRPNGMVIRLQGFDRGVFGGNYHTHNMLHMPPGLDVVCYSNGEDYARGFRHALKQAAGGRVVMLVDSTNLLNIRHIIDGDDAWKRPYPGDHELLPFDHVTTYGRGRRLGIVAYGNTVPLALQAQHELSTQLGEQEVVVIDSPYLNSAQPALAAAVAGLERVVFADPCKQGQHPFAAIITQLQSQGQLPARWRCVAAEPAYNPLGSVLTFTSKADILAEATKLLAE